MRPYQTSARASASTSRRPMTRSATRGRGFDGASLHPWSAGAHTDGDLRTQFEGLAQGLEPLLDVLTRFSGVGMTGAFGTHAQGPAASPAWPRPNLGFGDSASLFGQRPGGAGKWPAPRGERAGVALLERDQPLAPRDEHAENEHDAEQNRAEPAQQRDDGGGATGADLPEPAGHRVAGLRQLGQRRQVVVAERLLVALNGEHRRRQPDQRQGKQEQEGKNTDEQPSND